MAHDEAQALRAKIAELTEELARSQDELHAGRQSFLVAHLQALEAALIALAIEMREESGAPDWIERVSARLTNIASPAMRRLNDLESRRSADALESLASRLDDVVRRPKSEK